MHRTASALPALCSTKFVMVSICGTAAANTDRTVCHVDNLSSECVLVNQSMCACEMLTISIVTKSAWMHICTRLHPKNLEESFSTVPCLGSQPAICDGSCIAAEQPTDTLQPHNISSTAGLGYIQALFFVCFNMMPLHYL